MSVFGSIVEGSIEPGCRVRPALNKIIIQSPSFAALALWMRHENAPDDICRDDSYQGDFISPAWMKGKTISYGPTFETFKLNEQMGIAAHIMLHVAYMHNIRAAKMKGTDRNYRHDLFQIAADAVVNESLRHQHWLAIPGNSHVLSEILDEHKIWCKTHGRPDPKHAAPANWSVEDVYRLLSKWLDDVMQPPAACAPDADGESDGQGQGQSDQDQPGAGDCDGNEDGSPSGSDEGSSGSGGGSQSTDEKQNGQGQNSQGHGGQDQGDRDQSADGSSGGAQGSTGDASGQSQSNQGQDGNEETTPPVDMPRSFRKAISDVVAEMDPDIEYDESGIRRSSSDIERSLQKRMMDWDQRIARAMAGDKPGGVLHRLAADIPKTDTPWEKVLRSQVLSAILPIPEFDPCRPSKRWIVLSNGGRNLEIPFTRRIKRHRRTAKIAAMIDSSGSITDDILDRFAAELSLIQERTKAELYVIICDAAVQHVALVPAGGFRKVLSEIQFKGRGGTDFRPAFEKAEEYRPDIGVYLTDTWGDFPDMASFKTIWAVPMMRGDTPPAVPFGSVLPLN